MHSKNIQNTVRLKNAINMIFPGILLILVILFFINSPLQDILFPFHTNELSGVGTAYNNDCHYVDLTVDRLYDSGLDCIRNGKRVGRYYYSFENNYCYFFLISVKHLNAYAKENGPDLSTVNNITIKAKAVVNPRVLNDIITDISHDLSWTHAGMSNRTSKYLISEPDYPFTKACVIAVIFLALTAISAVSLLYSLLCICCPYIYRPVLRLRRYGKIRGHIQQANAELKNAIRLNDGRFIITTNYLMICSTDDFQIIPLEYIIWAYKFSSYHPLKYKNRKITYTLCVYGKHSVSLISPHNFKINADNVLEYLHNYNPGILIGYSREQEALAKSRT